MKLKLFQVDAFTDQLFAGNPAAVCPLEKWLDDALLQAIAAENNLAETAFFIPDGDGYHLRWFTPAAEVKLCGHATLATAHVLFEVMGVDKQELRFSTLSGILTVTRDGNRMSMDFPGQPSRKHVDSAVAGALGKTPAALFESLYYIALFDNADEVAALRPDMKAVEALPTMGVVATAPGRDADFVSRFFAPSVGVPEDPVTGSAHCALAPFWAQKLSKNQLEGHQISSRGGRVYCEVVGDRVILSGKTALYLEGMIHLPQ